LVVKNGDTADNSVLPSNTEFCILEKVKTTLDIDDELLVKAKALSARERKSLTALIEEGLRLRLRGSRAAKRSAPVALAIFRGRGGIKDGVDPLSNSALLDLADDDA
jgi:hypothetical protein